jgi:hypothetical protein
MRRSRPCQQNGFHRNRRTKQSHHRREIAFQRSLLSLTQTWANPLRNQPR